MDEFLSMFDFGYDILLAFLAVLFLMSLPILVRKLQGPVTYITPFDLSAKVERGDDIAVIDIRKPAEFQKSHAEGALNITPDALLGRLTQSADALSEFSETPVALICQSDLASIKTAKKLERLGLGNVFVVKGGMNRWRRDNIPVVYDA